MTVLRVLLTFAVDRDYRRDNPAKQTKKLKMGRGHATWPDEAVERFLASARPMMALALKLALYTGQRQGDVLRMSWSDYDGEQIHVVQSKTGARLRIPVLPALKEALDGQKPMSPIILTTSTGKPLRQATITSRRAFESEKFSTPWTGNPPVSMAPRPSGPSGVFCGVPFIGVAR